MFMHGCQAQSSLDGAASSFLYSTFRMLPGWTRITGGMLLPRYRNSDFPEAASDAATSLTGVVVCRGSGNDRSCPLAATAASSPMLANHPPIVPRRRLEIVL